ncbi:MAG TPA: hypothetical protein VE861_05790 [Gemmatimonadaceae bacterium]|nr:hypothetical protein [Gemmatimonadaceae bacterium]
MTPASSAAVRGATPLRSDAVHPSAAGSGTPGGSSTVDRGIPYASRPTPSISTPAIRSPTLTALPPLEYMVDADADAVGQPVASAPTPAGSSAVGQSTSAGARPMVPPPPPTPGQLVGAPESAAPAPATAAPVPTGDPRRVINPFLRSDPMTRAKRLARALVSDMVAYQPAKRTEGLANGTLKQLFRDEIRKSYDEYVEQVGREVAESTAFFQDALNEVLAEGKRVF